MGWWHVPLCCCPPSSVDVRVAFFGNLQMDFLMGKWPPLKKGGVTVAKEGLKRGRWGWGGVAEKGWRQGRCGSPLTTAPSPATTQRSLTSSKMIRRLISFAPYFSNTHITFIWSRSSWQHMKLFLDLYFTSSLRSNI